MEIFLKNPNTLNCPIFFTITKTSQSVSFVTVYDLEASVDSR